MGLHYPGKRGETQLKSGETGLPEQENPEFFVLERHLNPLQRVLLCTRLQAGCFRLLLLFKAGFSRAFFRMTGREATPGKPR